MRSRFTPVLMGICLLGPGCSFMRNIERNLVQEPKIAFDEAIMIKRHERLARMAWDQMVSQYGCQFSEDYRNGFIDGFVDYLTYGGVSPDGNGEVPIVPAVPPPYYRHAKRMSPQGLQASEEWFMGFRHGSNTALASGLRQLAVVPVFDKPNPSAEVVPGRFQSLPGRSPGATEEMPAGPPALPPPAVEGEPLPTPRTVPPGEGEPKPPAGPVTPPAGPVTPPAQPAVPPSRPMTPPAGPVVPPPPGNRPPAPPVPPPPAATAPPSGPAVPPG